MASQGDNGQNNTAKKKGILAFFEKSSLIMFGLGFASGMPNQLAGTALAVWMRDAGISLTLLALLGLATLTYALKFLWAPIVDRVAIPVLDKLLGRRRSWMLLTQLVVMVGLFLITMQDPAKSLIPFAALAVLIAFAGATQDIAIDAWRIEVAQNNDELGVLTATYQWGYRIAILVTGAAPLFIAQYFNGNEYKHLGWSMAYGAMALLMLIPVIATTLAPREHAAPAPRWQAPADIKQSKASEMIEWLVRLLLMVWGATFLAAGLAGKVEPIFWLTHIFGTSLDDAKKVFEGKPWGAFYQVFCAIIGLVIVYFAARPIPNYRTKPGAYFDNALGEPLRNFFGRFENTATAILVFICVYRIAEFLLNITGALYLDAGFTKAEIATATKFFGVVTSALGAGLAGWGIIRFGLFRCLVFGAFSQPLSHIPFIAISYFGNTHFPMFDALHIQPVLWAAIGVDNVSAGFAGSCLVVYMSRLTHSGFTATQYALFSSLYALPGKLIAAMSGRVVEGAAKASHDGLTAFLVPIFSHLPQGSFAAPALKLGVAPQALATGYAIFFIYTIIMGIFGVVMAFAISQGAARRHVEEKEA